MSGATSFYNDVGKAQHGMYRYSQACGDQRCDWRTGFSHDSAEYMVPPEDCYEGAANPRHSHLGSYVRSAVYTQGCIGEDCNNSYASRSRCKPLPNPYHNPGHYGLSSGDLMFPGPQEGCGDHCNFDVSRYDPCGSGMIACDPCQIKDDCHPFDDTVIDEPRDLAYLDGLRGDPTFITTRFNITRDPRGDIPVVVDDIPEGASVTTHGQFWSCGNPWRGYVY